MFYFFDDYKNIMIVRYSYHFLHQTNNIECQRNMSSKIVNTSKGRCHSSPSIGELNKREIFFKKKLQSIRDYLHLLEDTPEQANKAEMEWQKHFYKSELKVAISINFSLVKLVSEKEKEISELILQIGQLKKKTQENYQQFDDELICFQNENNQLQANRRSFTPKKYKEKAFQAERKILGAKLSQEKEEFKKIMIRQQDLLKSNKEENYFLREHLFKMGEKVADLEHQNIQLIKLNAELKKKSNFSEEKGTQENKIGRVLNFSPIQMRLSDDQIDFDLISFKNLETSDKKDEFHPFKEEIKQLDKIIELNTDEKVQISEKEALNSKIKQYEQMEKDYRSLKQQVANYREIIKKIQTEKCDEESEKFKDSNHQRIEQMMIKKQPCSECQKLKTLNKDIFAQLQNASEKIKSLDQKMLKMVSLSQTFQQDLSCLFLGTQ